MTDSHSIPVPPARAHEAMAQLRPVDRERVEDLLRALLECEHSGEAATDARLAGMVGVPLEQMLHALARAQTAGLAENTGSSWHLSSDGRELAVLVMRAHRLIETRLARESSVPAGAWHDIAHAKEHRLTRDDVNRLADSLGNPRFDPHGDPIPTRDGRMPEREGKSLLAWPPGLPGKIAHIEDEPPTLFARLAEAGIHAGMRLTLRSVTSQGVDVTIEGRNTVLPLELAALVRVRGMRADESETPQDACRLSDVRTGAAARVVGLLAGCIGAERSRLLDLGFVPGSHIEPSFQSPFDGPMAYRVRGTLVALRREQADQVLVVPVTAA